MNAHLIKITYVGPTNTRGSRVKLTSQRFERDSATFGYRHQFNNTFDQAVAWLREHGYTIVCSGEMPNAYWAAVEQFKPLREAKAV